MRKTKSGVNFRTTEELNKMNPDIPNLTRSELAKYVSRYASMANKRLRRLEKVGLTRSAGYKKAMRLGGNFSVKGKNKKQLLSELNRVLDFLSMKSSTVKGQRAIEKNAEKYIDLSDNGKLDAFNSVLDRLMELDQFKTLQASWKSAGTDVADRLYEMMINQGKDPETALTEMIAWLDEQLQLHDLEMSDIDFNELL